MLSYCDGSLAFIFNDAPSGLSLNSSSDLLRIADRKIKEQITESVIIITKTEDSETKAFREKLKKPVLNILFIFTQSMRIIDLNNNQIPIANYRNNLEFLHISHWNLFRN